jgi:hypothetical protein
VFVIDILAFFTSWEFVIFVVICAIGACVSEWAKSKLLTRILVYYPMLVIVTFTTAALVGLVVFMWVYVPIMWIHNGILSTDHGLFSKRMDADRVNNLHACLYWTVIFMLAVFVFIRKTIKTELEINKNKKQ